jgi:hypothetical protein
MGPLGRSGRPPGVERLGRSFKDGRGCVNRRSGGLAANINHAMRLIMRDERTLAALERIDRALARIEAAAAKPAPGAANDEELESLHRRHSTLRQRVEGAIREIDLLLEPEKG